MPIETSGSSSRRPPSADVYLTERCLVLELEVPGFAADELTVSASEGTVTVSGNREHASPAHHYLLQERGPRAFRRDFHVPAGSDAAKLSVHVRDGVLVVRMPRAEIPLEPAVDLPHVAFKTHPDVAPV